jgi:hypothetical protein
VDLLTSVFLVKNNVRFAFIFWMKHILWVANCKNTLDLEYW